MHTKSVSNTHPLPGMTPEEWDRVRVSKSAAELKAMGCVTESVRDCCAEDACCPDHDEDCKKVAEVRAKALAGRLTAQEIQEHNEAEIRAKAKGLLS